MRKLAAGVVLFAGGLVLWFGIVGSARTDDKAKKAPKTAQFIHSVVLYLTKDAPTGQADAMIADAYELLADIPSVRGIRAGKPVVKPTPDIAKTDFQVGLTVTFDNLEGLDIYIKHPLHLKYVEKHGKYLDREKLAVYDYEDKK